MLPITRNNLPESSTDAAYPLVIAIALKNEVGDSRQAIKTLTRWTGASDRTVQNWLAAVRGPSGPHLLALAAHSAAVHGAYLKMTGRIAQPAPDIETSIGLLREALVLLTRNAPG